MINLIIIIIVTIVIWLLSRTFIDTDNETYKSEFNKLTSDNSENDKQIMILGYLNIENRNINKLVKIGKYIFKVKLVEVKVESNKRSIKVYIEYKNNIGIIDLNGKTDKYNNIQTSFLNLDQVESEYYKIYYSLAIKEIYTHDITEDWYGLVITLNRLVEQTKLKKPLNKTAVNQPIINNLLNPLEDELYTTNRTNNYAYKTPFKSHIDTYGIIYKENQDNASRTQDIIIKNINK